MRSMARTASARRRSFTVAAMNGTQERSAHSAPASATRQHTARARMYGSYAPAPSMLPWYALLPHARHKMDASCGGASQRVHLQHRSALHRGRTTSGNRQYPSTAKLWKKMICPP